MVKFYEWYKTINRQPIHSYEKEIKLGWDGCKGEVIKMIENSTTINGIEIYFGTNEERIKNLIKEIKELL
jgi:hypothetical protein